MSRNFKLVVGRTSLALPCASAINNGLETCVALVLSTYRPEVGEMVHDEPLWAAFMRAASRCFKADDVQVYRANKPGLLDRLRGRNLWLALGSLEQFIPTLLADPDEQGWTEVHWRRDGKTLAIARCEAWSAVGGPEPYHDSYTSRIWLYESMVEALLTEFQATAPGEDAELEALIRL